MNAEQDLARQLFEASAQIEDLAARVAGRQQSASVADQQEASAVRAFTDCPQEVLERLADGLGTAADWQVADELMARDGQHLGRWQTQEAYLQIAAYAASHNRRGRPLPVQDLAWQVLQRRKAAMAPADEGLLPWDRSVPPTPMQPLPPSNDSLAQWLRLRSTQVFLGACGLLFATGLGFIVTHPNDTLPGAGDWIISGLVLMLGAIAAPVLTMAGLAIQVGHRKHQAWLNSMPPSQRARVRQAEQMAMAAGATALLVADATHRRHERERQELLNAIRGRK